MRMFVFATALGPCGLTWSARGITGVVMPGSRRLAGAAVTAVPPDDAPAFVVAAAAGIVALLDGEPRDLCDIPVDDGALDDFRRAVLARTRETGPGTLTTYGAIARALEIEGGARAVGTALGSNPFPIIVPCHRVVAADGALTGFSAPGGVDTKRRMLQIERAPGFTHVQDALFA